MVGVMGRGGLRKAWKSLHMFGYSGRAGWVRGRACCAAHRCMPVAAKKTLAKCKKIYREKTSFMAAVLSSWARPFASSSSALARVGR